MFADGKVFIDDAADYFQLPALRMIANEGNQGHLFQLFRAFCDGHYICNCCYIKWLAAFIMIQGEKNNHREMRFFDLQVVKDLNGHYLNYLHEQDNIKRYTRR
jgi:hypothetical protein